MGTTKLRKKIFYDSSILAGYNEKEARDMSENAFNIFIEGRNNVTLCEGVMDTLESLQKKYSLGVITNGNADLKQIGMDHLFEHCFSSADTHAHKPDPRAFEALINATKLKPEEICHVGDHPENDVEAAMNLGMKAVWLNLLDGKWPQGKKPADIDIESWWNLEKGIESL